MARPRRPELFLALLASAAAAHGAGEGPDAAALFARNCAACHGLDGSGTGPSVLDRPARNFKEGGFSFGNTVEAIERTIAHGIPGSPMPAFEAALSPAERRALAEYVVTLAPPVQEVSEAETILVVRDEPLVVRGILPPLVEGGPKIPRGLLLGTPDGLTFEYDVDDVRLVAVRAGEFVKRTDWGGRGGSPLEPLGKVVWSDGDGRAGGRWRATPDVPRPADGLLADFGELAPLRARLLATSQPAALEPDTARARLSYALVRADEHVGLVTESGGGLTLGPASGFVVEVDAWRMAPDSPWIALSLAAHDDRGAWVPGNPAAPPDVWRLLPDQTAWWSRTFADGSAELLGVAAERDRHGRPSPLVDLRGAGPVVVLSEAASTLRISRLLVPAGDAAALPALMGRSP